MVVDAGFPFEVARRADESASPFQDGRGLFVPPEAARGRPPGLGPGLLRQSGGDEAAQARVGAGAAVEPAQRGPEAARLRGGV